MTVRLWNETYETFCADGCNYSAKFDDEPFAAGACKYAFQGVFNNVNGAGPRCVTKVFKSANVTNFTQWAPDVAASNTAKGYAERFGHEITFVIPQIAMMKTVSGIQMPGQFPILDQRFVKVYDHVAIEQYIPGVFEHFNSNGGCENGMHPLMTAFCHWTWTVSGHKHMVCDLQGVRSGNKYILTDPVIHSSVRPGEFGPTDLGVYGMKQVLGNHQCNHLCYALGLNNPLTGVYVNPGPRSTTYSFQVPQQELMMAQLQAINYGLSVIPE